MFLTKTTHLATDRPKILGYIILYEYIYIYNLVYKRCNDLLLRGGTKRAGSKDEVTANKGRKRKVIGRDNVKNCRQKKKKLSVS